jgi:predicted transcriptional regulator
MQIDLPDDLMQRVKLRAATVAGASEVDIIRKGLDALDWQDSERVAVGEGIDTMNQGRVQDFDEFDRAFREKNGIAPDA